MLARVWRGVVGDDHADEYAEYMQRTGIVGYTSTPGNRGVHMLRRKVERGWEFVMFSLWDSMEAIEAFAGPNPEQAVFYADDDRYLVERDLLVRHYEVHTTATPE